MCNNVERRKSSLGRRRVLTDDGCNDGDPTCEAIVEGIAWLVEGAETGDCLFFHYSGHGGQMRVARATSRGRATSRPSTRRRDTDCAEDDGFDETLIPCGAGPVRSLSWVAAPVVARRCRRQGRIAAPPRVPREYSNRLGDESGSVARAFTSHCATRSRADYQSAGQIPDDLLWKELVNKVPEGVRLTAIMDCCHSGAWRRIGSRRRRGGDADRPRRRRASAE